jgi:hypothetical protein
MTRTAAAPAAAIRAPEANVLAEDVHDHLRKAARTALMRSRRYRELSQTGNAGRWLELRADTLTDELVHAMSGLLATEVRW